MFKKLAQEKRSKSRNSIASFCFFFLKILGMSSLCSQPPPIGDWVPNKIEHLRICGSCSNISDIAKMILKKHLK